MRNLRKQVLQAVIAVIIVPCIVLSTALRLNVSSQAEEIPTEEDVKSSQKTKDTMMIPVFKASGNIQQMNLEEYIANVVLGEVSSSFHPEALKAQAVAARTYTLRCIISADKHPQGAVCTDYRCCQAYREPDEYLRSGGTEDGLSRICEAVEATKGEVLYYNDELICATYFASSGGKTEDAKVVWGGRYPYLKSVSSPGEEGCGYYYHQILLTPMELQQRLGVTLTGSPKDWFGMVTYTNGNGVALMRIGGKLYTGVELRKLFDLRSTIIEVFIDEEKIMFKTKGYGHRVGMSQHGANAMASSGYNYRKILEHYYSGIILKQYQHNND